MKNQVNISLKTKLLAIIMTIAFISTMSSFLFMYFIESENKTEESTKSWIIHAKMVSEYVSSAIIFDDKDGTIDILKKMNLIPMIQQVIVLDSNKNLYASSIFNQSFISDYNIDNIESSIEPKSLEIKEYTHIIQPIIYKGTNYGYVYIIFSNYELNQQLKKYILVMVLILLTSLIISYFISIQFQKIISKPIINISSFIKNITNTGNYDQKITNNYSYEIGDLYLGFNELLNQILLKQRERNQAEKSLILSEERYKNLVEYSPIPIFVMRNQKFIFLNSSAYNIFGVKNEEDIITKNVKDFIQFEVNTGSILYPNIYNQILSFNVIKPDKSITEIEAKAQRIEYLGSDATMVICMDVTERKNAERKVKELNIELEKKVATRTKELQNTLKELNNEIIERKKAELKLQQNQVEILTAYHREKELNELKSRLVSMVSHEYRNPMSIIKSSSDMLPLFFENQNKEKFQKHIDKIQNSITHMISLMDDVLTYSRLGKIQELSLADINIIALANDITDNLNSLFEEPRIIKDFEMNELCIKTDPKLLSYIFNNLLTNALKYSQIEDSVIFKLYTNPNNIIIEVIDNGIGIPPEDLKSIFEPFHRAKNTGVIQGTGFGLSIVKKSIEIMGGKIDVISHVNSGSKFIVNLNK